MSQMVAGKNHFYGVEMEAFCELSETYILPIIA